MSQPLSETAQSKPAPGYGPVYAAALYPDMVGIFRNHGYALAVHGSLQRDFDLVAIPWIDEPSAPEAVLQQLTTELALRVAGDGPTMKPHGRMTYTVIVGFGSCFVDLSFMPCRPKD